MAKKAIESGPISRGYTEEMEHWAWCIRNFDFEHNKPKLPSRGRPGRRGDRLDHQHGHAASNVIEFKEEWFDIDSDETPEGEKPEMSGMLTPSLRGSANRAVFLVGYCRQGGSDSSQINRRSITVEKWPIGVFASIDAGLGVKLEVVRELGVPTIQLHAPEQKTRTPEQAQAFLGRLKEAGITLTAVFGGFEGESYADIPTVLKTVGLVPPETRAARTQEMKEIADFARLLGCAVVALHLGFVPHDKSDPLYAEVLEVTRDLCDHCQTERAAAAPGDRTGAGRRAAAIHRTTSTATTCSSTSTRPT